MYNMLIISFSLFLLSSQYYLRQNEEIDSLSFCFPMNSQFISNNSKYELEILCYGDECYGKMNKNKTNSIENIKLSCNQFNCNILENKNNEKEEGQFNNNDTCENCTEIILTCYKGKCLGGFTKNDNNSNHNKFINHNESNNKENDERINNISYSNNEDGKISKNSFNRTLIKINCLDKICYIFQINDLNDINNNNDNKISCICSSEIPDEKEEKEEREKEEREKEEREKEEREKEEREKEEREKEEE